MFFTSVAMAAGAPAAITTHPSDDDSTIGISANGGGFGHGAAGDAVIPPADPATTTINALRALADPKLSVRAKRQWAAVVPPGLKSVLPNMRDPIRLDADAHLLVDYGVEPDAIRLDYLGENPTIQARLRPVAQAAYDMFEKVGKDAKSQAAILAPLINVQNQNTTGARWEKLDLLASTGPYSRDCEAYFLALSLPRAERPAIAHRAIASLQQYDTADSDVMPIVHMIIGKLNLLAGNYDAATRYFDAVGTADKSITPAPTLDEQYEGKYFAIIVELKKGNLPNARLRFEDLLRWQHGAMKEDQETAKGIAAANQMLRCRIFRLEAATATDPAAKDRAAAAAAGIVQKLKIDRPDLQNIEFGPE
jgi:hypothetical protein